MALSGPTIENTQDNRVGRLTTALGEDVLLLTGLHATERLSEAFTITVEAFSPNPQPLHTLLGDEVSVTFASAQDPMLDRVFAGIVWEYSELEGNGFGHYYTLTLRPRTELLTLNKRNRIFQNKSVVDIAKSLLVSGFETRLNGGYGPVEYCVQYQESDFAFLSRLLEYEGIYYYYDHAASGSTMVLVDDRNTHRDMTPASVAVLTAGERDEWGPIRTITERRGLGPAKVTVADYDFESPDTKLMTSKAADKVTGSPPDRGQQSGTSVASWAEKSEVYDFPAKYTARTASSANRYSMAWLDAHRRRMARSFAEGRLFAAQVGRRLTLTFGADRREDYLIVGTDHRHTASPYGSGTIEETFDCTIELMPATDQYRPAHRTPRPRIMGPQTAIVVGPAGEEIHTDRHGRIKVQFFWDREGKKDENSSCFIRVVQSGAGQGWGSFALPRIGQEVVVEFLDGDPDRPLVTGALYNASNTPPAELPANKTQYGMKSRITKGGGGYNQHWFEDKKDAEVVWFRAERDYKANIVNKDEDRQYDKGNRKTTFLEGNDELVVSKGTRTETIQGDDTKTIKQGGLKDTVELGDETHIVKTGMRTTTINKDETLEVTMGDRATTIKMGNDSLKLSMGNVTINVDLGSHKTTAMQSIELTCGASKLKLDPTQISLEAMMIKIDAKTVLQLKGLMVQSEASAMQIVKGGLVMIN